MLKLLTKGSKSDKTSIEPKNDPKHHLLDSETTRVDFTDVKLTFEPELQMKTSMKKKVENLDFSFYTDVKPQSKRNVERLNSLKPIDDFSDEENLSGFDFKPAIKGFTRLNK